MSRLNWPIAIASVALSVMLWMVVYAQSVSPETPQRFAAKLSHEGLDTSKFVVTAMEPVIRFSAVGPENKLQEFSSSNVVAVADLSRAEVGSRLYPVQILPEGLKAFLTARPLYTKVTIEPLARKRIPVAVEGQGRLADPTLRLTGTAIDPEEITIQGPKSQVDAAVKARVWFQLGELDTSSAKPYPVDAQAVDENGKILPDVQEMPIFVNITPILAVAPAEKEAVVSPVFKGTPAPGYVPDGYELDPKQVTLRGPSLSLAAVSKVRTEPIDVNGISETTEFTARIVAPEGIRLVERNATVRVRYILRAVPETGRSPKPGAAP